MSNLEKKERPPCPYCSSSQILKNGSTHHKKQKYLCKNCRRQFIENPTKKYISTSTKHLIKRLLLEKIPLIGMARSLQISMTWLQSFVNNFYRHIPCEIVIQPESSINLIVECDEIWSFVKSKQNAIYIWLAFDRNTRHIVGVHLGDRSRESAKKFWETLPQEYQEQAIVYTDLWLPYQEVIPTLHHHPSVKNSGETNHIERFHNTLRQRCSRLIRKSLSFSKNFFNHEGAIWYFIHHYNEFLIS